MAIKFDELMKNYEESFDKISNSKNEELVEFNGYLRLFDKLIDTDSSFTKVYHTIDEKVKLDSDKKKLAFMFALDELGHIDVELKYIDVSHGTFNESKKKSTRKITE